MSLQASFWTYPWDVLDLGVETAVREIVERAGVGGISLAAAYHAGKFLQPRSPRRKVYFPEDGAIYFQPTPSFYEGLRIKPRTASLLAEGDALRLLEKRSRADGFRLSAWVVGLHNTRIGTAYPDVAVQNAFGDRYPHGLCPNNPDVRRYVTRLLADLTHHYELDAVELESLHYAGYYHEFHHEKDGVGLTPREQFLMSPCFCDHCRARAAKDGVDADAAAQTVRRQLENAFARPVPEAGSEAESEPELEVGAAGYVDREFAERGPAAFRDTPEVEEYLAWRAGAVTSLAAEVREAVHPRTEVYFLGAFTPQTAWLSGVDADAVAEKTDGLIVCSYDTPPEKVEADVRMSAEALGPKLGKKLLTGLRLTYPDARSEEWFAAKVRAAARAGADGFVLYNYGLIPAARLDWARRSLAAKP